MRSVAFGLLLVGTLQFAFTNAVAGEAVPIFPLPANLDDIGAPISRMVDGKAYAAEFGQEGKGNSGKDVVTFKDGLMATALCIKFGFKPAPYFVRVEGSKLHFRSEMVSAEQGKMIFSGYIEGDRLIARADWSQARWYWTIDIISWFDGRLADPNGDHPVYVN